MYMKLICKKSDTARQYVNRWLPIVAAAQITKKKEKDFIYIAGSLYFVGEVKALVRRKSND